MSNKQFVVIGVFFLCVSAFSMMVFAAEPMVRVETTMENFKITEMMVGCPQVGSQSAFVMDAIKLTEGISDREADTLDNLLTEFDIENGVKVEGKTQVQNFQTQKDQVKVTTRGPNKGAGKRLCDFLRTLL